MEANPAGACHLCVKNSPLVLSAFLIPCHRFALRALCAPLPPAKPSVGLPNSASFGPQPSPLLFFRGTLHPQVRGMTLEKPKGELEMESSTPKKTCEERIDEELKGRIEQLLPDLQSWGVLKCARHLKAEGRPVTTADLTQLHDAVLDLALERATESVLSIEKIITFKLCLSWGGPSDYLELHWCSEARAWVGGRYIFQDWFDGASRTLTTEQVEELATLFGIDPEAG